MVLFVVDTAKYLESVRITVFSVPIIEEVEKNSGSAAPRGAC